MKSVLGILSALCVSTSVFAKQNIDVNKLCLDNYCIGDPASKHGGVRGMKASFFPETPLQFTMPSCTMVDKGWLIPPAKNLKNNSVISIVYEPFPEYSREGVDSYYRIVRIKSVYTRIGNDDLKTIYKNILERANIKVNPKNSNSSNVEYWGNLNANSTLFLNGSEVAGYPTSDSLNISLRVDDESAILSLFRGQTYSVNNSQAFKSQLGCTSKAPKL